MADPLPFRWQEPPNAMSASPSATSTALPDDEPPAE